MLISCGALFGGVGLVCLLFPRVVTRFRTRQYKKALERFRSPLMRLLLIPMYPSLATTILFGAGYLYVALSFAALVLRVENKPAVVAAGVSEWLILIAIIALAIVAITIGLLRYADRKKNVAR